MLELSLRWHRLTAEHTLKIAVNILLAEIIRKFAYVHNSLVERVTIVSDSTMSIVGNSQLALKRRDEIAEGWYPLNCYVGDFLRHI